MLATGAVASANSSRTLSACERAGIPARLSFTKPRPWSPVTAHQPGSYAGFVSPNPVFGKVGKIVIEANAGGRSAKAVATITSDLGGSRVPFSFAYTPPKAGTSTFVALVYYPGVPPRQAVARPSCKVMQLVDVGKANRMPEVPFAAGLPPLLGAGVILTRRRRRTA
jgi:hypothetical protein